MRARAGRFGAVEQRSLVVVDRGRLGRRVAAAQGDLEAVDVGERVDEIEPGLLARHFLRKHGPGATYGQAGAGPG